MTSIAEWLLEDVRDLFGSYWTPAIAGDQGRFSGDSTLERFTLLRIQDMSWLIEWQQVVQLSLERE